MFEGFRPETIDFLFQIKFNNNREWFTAHKQEYLDYLYNPMKELGAAVFAQLGDTTGMKLRVSRIYRDARRSNGVPYKDSLWLSIDHESDYWATVPCMYFDICAESYSYGCGVVYPKPESMARYRAALEAHPQKFLTILKDMKKKTGMELHGDAYKRQKPCENAALIPYYNLKNVIANVEHPADDALFRPELASNVAETFRALLPFYQFCRDFTSE